MTKRNALIACPHCNSDNVEWSAFSLEVYSDGSAGLLVGCNSCAAEWAVGIVVEGYTDLSYRPREVPTDDNL